MNNDNKDNKSLRSCMPELEEPVLAVASESLAVLSSIVTAYHEVVNYVAHHT
jgi:hypothetical protein